MVEAQQTTKTKAVRLPVETVRRVKLAAAAGGESMQAWLDGAVALRLERDRKLARGDRTRVATVVFESTEG